MSERDHIPIGEIENASPTQLETWMGTSGLCPHCWDLAMARYNVFIHNEQLELSRKRYREAHKPN